MVIEIPIVPVPLWKENPLFDYFDELKGYMIIINAKRDYKRIKTLTKVVRKLIQKDTVRKTGVKPIIKFKIYKYKEEER